MRGTSPIALLDVLTERGFEVTAVVDEMNGGAVRDFAPLWVAVSAGMVDRNWCGNVFARRL
jgi:hypothetical protein